MTDLLDFIRARLDEDEQVARACWADTWAPGNDRGDRTVTDTETGTVVCWLSGNDPAGAEHIALHDPARVLREVAAKRQIVERAMLLAKQAPAADDIRALDTATGAISALGGVLRDLASVYAEHPDYRQEWRP